MALTSYINRPRSVQLARFLQSRGFSYTPADLEGRYVGNVESDLRNQGEHKVAADVVRFSFRQEDRNDDQS